MKRALYILLLFSMALTGLHAFTQRGSGDAGLHKGMEQIVSLEHSIQDMIDNPACDEHSKTIIASIFYKDCSVKQASSVSPLQPLIAAGHFFFIAPASCPMQAGVSYLFPVDHYRFDILQPPA